MSVIGIVSMKGGAGKTSIAANLGMALATELGPNKVSVLDLDPQNALRWHFGFDEVTTKGVCQQSLQGKDWRNIALASETGVICLPYGAVDETDRIAFETLLQAEPSWVGTRLASADLDHDAVVLIDTPPGSSVYLKQVFACADLVLIVLLPDAGSYATTPAMESWIDGMAAKRPEVGSHYILNQLNAGDPLIHDVADLLRLHLGARLCPVGIHRDEAVGEALAFQQTVLLYDPHGQASRDLKQLAVWLIETLNQ